MIPTFLNRCTIVFGLLTKNKCKEIKNEQGSVNDLGKIRAQVLPCAWEWKVH